MLRVANRPILHHVVDALVANGVTDITLVLGYRREKVQTYFGDGKRFGARFDYAFQSALTGTATALAAAPKPTDPFLLLAGDNLVDAALVKRALSAKEGAAVVVHRSESPSKYGVVSLSGDQVLSIEEKPADALSDWVNTGVYRLPLEFHARAKRSVEEGRFGMPDVLQEAIAQGVQIEAIRSDDLWADAVYPWDLLRLNMQALHRGASRTPISPGVHAEAPVLVGDDVTFGPGVVLGAGTVIGDNVHVGANSVIESSVIKSDVTIAPHAYMRNAILAEGVQVGPRFTALSGACHVRAADGWHDLEDFGAVVGEDARIGGNVTLEPGCLVGNRARIGTGAVVSGLVEDGAIIR